MNLPPNWEHLANDAALTLTAEYSERMHTDGIALTDEQLAHLCVQTSNALRSAMSTVATAAIGGCDVSGAAALEDVPKNEPDEEPQFGRN